MPSGPFFHSALLRSLAALATVFAMLLPVPARCASCTAGKECPHCVASQDAKPNSTRPCCRAKAKQQRPTEPSSSQGISRSASRCNCVAQPAGRTLPQVEKLTQVQELTLALASTPRPIIIKPAVAHIATSAAFSDLPPPVPHRILHCSWII